MTLGSSGDVQGRLVRRLPVRRRLRSGGQEEQDSLPGRGNLVAELAELSRDHLRSPSARGERHGEGRQLHVRRERRVHVRDGLQDGGRARAHVRRGRRVVRVAAGVHHHLLSGVWSDGGPKPKF